jgi:hypothetical protein
MGKLRLYQKKGRAKWAGFLLMGQKNTNNVKETKKIKRDPSNQACIEVSVLGFLLENPNPMRAPAPRNLELYHSF